MVENDITCGSVKKDEKSNKKIIFFNIFIILFTVSKAWGLDSSNRVYYVLAAIAAVFWVFALLGTKYEIKEILFCGTLLAISAVSLYCSGKIGAILPAMVIVAAKEISIDDVIKVMMKCWIVTVSVKVLLVVLGFIPNEIREKTNELALGRDSYKMGYGHPNLFAMAVAVCVLLVLYTYWGNIKWWWSLLIIAVATVVFIVSLSFTGTAVMLLAAGWCLINCPVNRFEVLNRIIDIIMIVVSTVFSLGMFVIVSVTGINENLDAVLYKYTSSRSWVSYNMMDMYPIKLFGQRFDGRVGYEIVDNAYVYTLIQLGLIMFCLMVIAYLCCIINTYKHRDTRRLFILAVFIAFGFMEQSFINPFINFSWLLITDVIWSESDGKCLLRIQQYLDNKK